MRLSRFHQALPSSNEHFLKQHRLAAAINTIHFLSRCPTVTTLPGRASSQKPTFFNGTAPSVIPPVTGSSSNVWVVDGRRAGHAVRRRTRERHGINPTEVWAEQWTALFTCMLMAAPLDLRPLQSTPQKVRSPSRSSDLGQPHSQHTPAYSSVTRVSRFPFLQWSRKNKSCIRRASSLIRRCCFGSSFYHREDLHYIGVLNQKRSRWENNTYTL